MDVEGRGGTGEEVMWVPGCLADVVRANGLAQGQHNTTESSGLRQGVFAP